ncbi:16S rRNA pseudouridine(516) synthase [Hydrogenophaga sp. 5NK40-0174]|uniref:16S rRNA pseudouridine(516) synthase n=1 Tax=Hydrogenophaga sp. 5NK40-0174 TaxID=3127649 RepID=UPI0033415D5A
MRLEEILYSQGFGTRRVCLGLIQQGHVRVGAEDRLAQDPDEDLETDGLVFRVQDELWAFQPLAYLMLNKPAGYECSQKPSVHPSVYTLLPPPLRQRPGGASAGVQTVGRLDQDTTGLLLLSDDGKFIHRMSSPKHHVPKVYQATVRDAMDEQQRRRLLEGVVLRDDPKPVKAVACEITGPHTLSLTLTEGKYHQVKRMLAAVGNLVTGLHRSQTGSLHLPDELSRGEWRWLTQEEVASLTARQT